MSSVVSPDADKETKEVSFEVEQDDIQKDLTEEFKVEFVVKSEGRYQKDHHSYNPEYRREN